jgi:hypothetical protein
MEENFSPQQSLQLIQSMISKAKADISQNRFFFLLWGWVAFSCIIGQFVLKVLVHYRHHYIVWLAIFVASVVSVVYSRRVSRASTRTYVGDSMSYLWTGLGISFGVLSFIITKSIGWVNAYPFFILLYGLGTFVSGRLLRSTPLVAGGIFNWCLAIASVFVHFDYQLLMAAAAILTSYIIPGHLIKPEKK